MSCHNQFYLNPVVDRTGLGNMLFPWARAEVFCKHKGGCILAPQWVKVFRLGPWIRRESDKRYYFSSFSNSGYVGGLRRNCILCALSHLDEVDALEAVDKRKAGFVVDFRGMNDFFLPLLGEQSYLADRLLQITAPDILAKLMQVSNEPFIGVHVRRGDFQGIGYAIDDAWYLRALDRAVEDLSPTMRDLPVRVFSDASPQTLISLLNRPNVVLMPKSPALLDLLLLSRSLSLVATSRSTFSMWAAFLGQMPSYWHSSSLPPKMLSSTESVVAKVVE